MTPSIMYVIKSIILPPGSVLILLIIGLICLCRSKHLAYLFILTATISLYLLSLPIVSSLLAKPLQQYSALQQSKLNLSKAQAIVVLGGGRYTNAPEYNGDTVDRDTLGRLRYAAKLYRQTYLPVLVSGGSVYSNRSSQAELMAQVLKNEFNIPVEWLENHSKNTRQDAKFSAAILHQTKIKTIYLVTDAVHIPRAKWSFEQYGIKVIPAPTSFMEMPDLDNFILYAFPNVSALSKSVYCLHEYFGMLWYLV